MNLYRVSTNKGTKTVEATRPIDAVQQCMKMEGVTQCNSPVKVRYTTPMQMVVATYMIDDLGKRFYLAFDNEKIAEDFAEGFGLEIVSISEMTLKDATRRGFDY